MKKILILIFCIALCLITVGCAKNVKNNAHFTNLTTSSENEIINESVDENIDESVSNSESTSTNKGTVDNNIIDNSNEKNNTSTSSSNTEPPTISKDSVLNLVEDFYGKTYKIELIKSSNNNYEYTVYNKMGNVYSNVTIDFNNSKMIENIVSTNETNEYDLNSIKSED